MVMVATPRLFTYSRFEVTAQEGQMGLTYIRCRVCLQTSLAPYNYIVKKFDPLECFTWLRHVIPSDEN